MYNSLNMFGIGNIFSGVCNTYTNYYGYGSGMGCCNSVFNYKGLMGLAIGSTIAPILGMITYKGISNAVANKQANSTSTLNGQINEILNKYNISDEKDMDKVVPDNSFDKEIIAAEENLKASEKNVKDAEDNVKKLREDLNKLESNSSDYITVTNNLNAAESRLGKAKSDLDDAKKANETAIAAKEQKIKDIEADKNTLNRLVEQRNEKILEDAEKSRLFSTSREKLDKIITPEGGKTPDYKNVTKRDINAAFNAYQATKAEKYKTAFIEMYQSYDGVIPLGSDLKAAYDLLNSQSS